MSDSILITIKKLLGIEKSYTPFDADIIIHINSAIAILNQIGVGVDGFVVNDENDTWLDFLGETTQLEMVKSYMYAKVRSMFDPPTGSIVAEALNKTLAELEWRISVTVDSKS